VYLKRNEQNAFKRYSEKSLYEPEFIAIQCANVIGYGVACAV